MELIPAKNNCDWAEAEKILVAVAEWLRLQETPLWQKTQISAEALQSNYKLSELYFLVESNEKIGLVFLQDRDEFFWPEISQNNSMYIHKLSLLLGHKGKGHGSKILDLVGMLAKQRNKSWLRLDCDDRQELNKFYLQNGFEFVESYTTQGYNIVKYQRPC